MLPVSVRGECEQVAPSLRRRLVSVLAPLVPRLASVLAAVLVPMGWLGVEDTWTALGWVCALLGGLSAWLYLLVATADAAIAIAERVEGRALAPVGPRERAGGSLSLVPGAGELSEAPRGVGG